MVVGPEAPLVAGLVDDLEKAGIKAFGPKAIPAQLEGSKCFTKQLCAANKIPTAGFAEFRDAESAKAYVKKHGAPIVVKADGLHAGKGVVVAMTEAEAIDGIDLAFQMTGNAKTPVVLEEFLAGEEASLFFLVDGEKVLTLAGAQDHKRAYDDDKGPNTGGMGAYSPAPVLTPEIERRVLEEIVKPTARALARAGTPYRGVLYAGLMIGADGPKLIEYNVRFGDPECQVLMLRLKDDLLTLMLATVDGTLNKVTARWHDEPALTVVMATKGYPGDYTDRLRDQGARSRRASAKASRCSTPEPSATARGCSPMADACSNVTASGKTVTEARARAYEAIGRIDWPEGFCRRDIAWRALSPRHGRA